MDITKKISITFLVLLFALFPFGQLGRFELLGITIHLFDIFAGLFVGSWLISKPKFIHPLRFDFICFVAAAGFALLINLFRVDQISGVIGIFYFLRFSVYVLLGFAVFDLIDRKVQTSGDLLNTLKKSGMYLIVFGLIQYLFFPDLRILQNWGWDNHYFRATGTFLDPGFFGILVVLFLLLLISKNWLGRAEKSEGWLTLLGLIALAASFSRASYLALVVGLSILNVFKFKPLFTLKLLLFFGAVLFILPKPGGEGVNLTRSSTVNYRISNYQEAIDNFQLSPIWGVGFNLYGADRNSSDNSHSRNGADSSLLFILATTGVIGFLIYLNLLKKIISTKDLLLVSSTFAILIHSFFNNSLFYPWVLVWWFVLIAVFVKVKE